MNVREPASESEHSKPGSATAKDALAWPVTFADAYCKEFACGAEVYEARILWRCLACRLTLLGRLINFSMPDFFKDDRDGIRRLGTARSREDFLSELDDLDYVTKRKGGFLRLKAGLRVSVPRLDRLQARLFP